MEHCVISERPIIRGHRFDLGVYREDDRYYATWFCDACSKRGQTNGLEIRAKPARKRLRRFDRTRGTSTQTP